MLFQVSAFVKSIRKIKGIILLNMAGLSLGLLSVIFIALWITHELSFDKWVEDSERIFRVEALMDFTGEPFVWKSTPAPLVEAMMKDYAEVETGVRVKNGYNIALEIGEDQFSSKNLYYASGSFFDIFSIRIIQGDPRRALDSPDGIVISERIVKKYFGDTDPIGKSILVDNKDFLVIKGVIENTPANSHNVYDYLISSNVFLKTVRNPDSWDQYNYYNYIKLRQEVNPEEVNDKLATYLASKKEGAKGQFFLNPLERLYLYRNPGFNSMVYPSNDKGPISRVIIFGIIGFVILIIAIINFVNLATAFSSQRSKEIGIRKASGARRADLLGSLFGESLTQTSMSVITALIFAVALLPLFNRISGKEFTLNDMFTLKSIVIYVFLILFTGLLAGVYPAFILSSFKPIKVLRNSPNDISQGGGFRKILVIVQFVMAIMFIFCIIIVNRQISFMQEEDLGFDQDRVMVYSPKADYEKVKLIAEEVENIPGVSMVALGGNIPVNMGNWNTFSDWDGNITGKKLKFHMMQVDDNYTDLLGFEIIEGRQLFNGPPRGEVVINEAAVRDMGIENPIGKRITHSWENQQYEIVGVVKDFHFRKLTDDIKPVFMFKSNTWWSAKLFVKLAPGADFKTIEKISSLVKDAVPGYPLNYIFLDEEINACYDDELRLSNLINIATLLSIIISSIGLFSLTAFSVRKKQKEIGIRKVHGSGVRSLLLILNREYWILIMISSLLALPAAYYLIAGWLNNYAYHISIKPQYFVITLISIATIATLTISIHTVRAANLNPADTLRDE